MNQVTVAEWAAAAVRPELPVEDRLRACDRLVRAGELDLAEPALAGLAGAGTAAPTARRLLAVCRQLRRWGITARLEAWAAEGKGDGPDFEGERSVLIARRPGARKTLIVFTGTARMVWVSLHVLHQLLPAEACHVVYLRDPLGLGYLAGLPELGHGYDATLAGFCELLAALGAHDLRCLGSSGGGYASLRYGLDLGARAVLAFAASTDLSPAGKALEMSGGGESAGIPPHALVDLRALYAAAADPPRLRLVYGAGNEGDAAESRRLGGLRGVTLHPVEYEGHDVIAQTIATGEFRRLVDDLLAD